MKHPIAFFAACLVSVTCMAQDIRYYPEDQVPSAADIASLLAPAPAEPGAARGGRTRGIRLLESLHAPARPPASAEAVAAPGAAPGVVPAPTSLQLAKVASVGSVALALRFGIDEAQMAPQQMAQLDALAEGIKRLPPHAVITIAGHTDAAGPAAYNMDLSLKRALTVRNYLVRVHGIPGKRLVAVGKGSSEPMNRRNPFAAENRRVQVSAEYDLA